MYETFDGKQFPSEKHASHYLDALYTNTMSNIASKLCRYSDGRHVKTMDWLDENMQALISASKIKEDMTLAADTEED